MVTHPADSQAVKRKRRQHHPGRSGIGGRGYLQRLGPGIVTGAADDDPSGIGTYSQVGAATGFSMIWTAPFLLPLAFAVQESCARLALVTGEGLAQIIRTRMSRWVLMVAVALVVIANTVNIAADLGAMSAALQLLVPVPQLVGVIGFAALILAAEIWIPYHQYSKWLRWLCLSLLAYLAVTFVAGVDWSEVAAGLLPRIDWSKDSLSMLIAVAGTTISPYLFFWQAAEEVELRNADTRATANREHLSAMRVDVGAGMLSGVVTMAAIMITSAATLHATGMTVVQTADQAAMALRPIAGDYAGVLFLLGILGTGLLSVPVLAAASSYAVAETFGWSESLEKKPNRAKAFYAVIAVSIVLGTALNLIGINPMQFLFLAAVLNGLAAPVLMGIVWWLARDARLLGQWRSPWWSSLLLGIATLGMVVLPLLWFFAP
ncbi:MAG TPA: divalent metal cation transporter [Microbacteriaceae bacterium]|nr:divalent metal cation transporter [Microbacteriaceae bacterium]